MTEYTPNDRDVRARDVPSEAEMREAWRAFTGPNRDHGFDTWIARVKRDAFEKGIATGYMRGYHDSEAGVLYSPPVSPTLPEEAP